MHIWKANRIIINQIFEERITEKIVVWRSQTRWRDAMRKDLELIVEAAQIKDAYIKIKIDGIS